MKKIDILNFITNFRQSPNDIKTHRQLVDHLGAHNEQTIVAMLDELKKMHVVKEVSKEGERAYQVAKK